MNTRELLEVVEDLNYELAENGMEEEYQFNLTTTGTMDIISVFLLEYGSELTLWDSEDDNVCEYMECNGYGKAELKKFISVKTNLIGIELKSLSDSMGLYKEDKVIEEDKFEFKIGEIIKISTNSSCDEYYVSLEEGNKVVLFWTELLKGHSKNGCSLDYTKELVETYVNDGIWKIVDKCRFY